ncbi:MAG: transcription termination factor NusA [Lentisphaeria bacterium]|nr:transcription termination factor NusA [Lentisphaeria bacterium]
MNNELLAMLEYIEQERGISKEKLVEALEGAITQALLSATKKNMNQSLNLPSEVTARLDLKTGQVHAIGLLTVVDSFPNNEQITIEKARTKYPDVQVGDKVEWEVTPQNFGRIVASTARQTIQQKLSLVEKSIARNEYKDKVGELVSGVVKRVEAGAIIVDLQKAEGIIQVKEKVPGETYLIGERINALLKGVAKEDSKGPNLILTRASADFVKKLFEREVTEIHDGVVEVAGIAREPGIRTKIAVRSNDPRVDPVGACVGMRGMRVRNITNELGNERVDIIRYDENIKTYAANALHPAKLEGIEQDDEHRMLTIRVDQENSRLAFGKKTQNLRLAQKLIGWNITLDIEGNAEQSFEEKKAECIGQLTELLSIAQDKAELLVNNGYLNLDGLKTAGMKDIAAIEGMDEATLAAIAAALEKSENGTGSAE